MTSSDSWGSPIARLGELHPGSITRVDREQGAIVLVREGEVVVALAANCPHAGAPLEQGALCSGRLICPWHKATFDIRSGALLEPPALEGLARYAVRIEGDDVYVAQTPEPIVRVQQNPQHADDPSHRKTFAIIGAGAAGAAACATLREFGFGGRILLIDVETTRPYDRTTLSKFVPSGDLKPDDVYPLLPDDFFSANAVECMDRGVVSLDTDAQEIELSDKQTVRYDAALVATGSEPARPDIGGLDEVGVRDHVVFLRSLDDARALDRLAAQAKRTLVVGGSFIGLETAAALRKRSIDVSVVMPHALPFAKQFGDDVAKRILRLHEANGIRFRREAKVDYLKWKHDQIVAHISALKTPNVEAMNVDLVVIGTGVIPRTAFIKGVARNPDGGIDVDASMRVSDTLFAAGDIAAFPFNGANRSRIEHWRVAQQQARIAAMNMTGMPVAPSIVPFFWTYHYDKRFDYVGHAQAGEWSKTVTIGSLETLEFIVLYVDDARVVAALGCGKESKMAWLAERMRKPLTIKEANATLG